MKEDNLKLVQKDIDEALSTIEVMEKTLGNGPQSKDMLKEKFLFLSSKVNEIERILINEGILE